MQNFVHNWWKFKIQFLIPNFIAVSEARPPRQHLLSQQVRERAGRTRRGREALQDQPQASPCVQSLHDLQLWWVSGRVEAPNDKAEVRWEQFHSARAGRLREGAGELLEDRFSRQQAIVEVAEIFRREKDKIRRDGGSDAGWWDAQSVPNVLHLWEVREGLLGRRALPQQLRRKARLPV